MYKMFANRVLGAFSRIQFYSPILIFVSIFPFTAHSTEIEDLDPGSIKPQHQIMAVDSRGIDMVSGTLKVPGMRVSIGSAGSGLAHDPGRNRHNMFSNVGVIEKFEITANTPGASLPVGTYYKVDFAGESNKLSASTGLSVSGDGGSITCSGTECTYTDKYGMIAVFNMQLCTDCWHLNNGSSSNQGILTKVTKPDGEVLEYFYRRHSQYRRSLQMFDMPNAVVSSLGWTLKYYFSDQTQDNDGWNYGHRTVTAINSRIEHCDPTARQCQSANAWPVSHMNIQAKSFSTVDGSVIILTNRSKLTAPGETKSDEHYMNYGRFDGNPTQSYKSPEGVTSGYTIAGYWFNTYYGKYETLYGAGVNKILNASIAGQQSTYDFRTSSAIIGPDGTYSVSDTGERLLSFTDKLNRKTSYEYEGGYRNRIKKVTTPDGSYTEYTYDGRGNITYVRKYPAGGGVALVTSAVYWTCNSGNKKYCNKPSSITDPNGSTTSYTYYAAHGGVDTITKPSVSVINNGITQTVAPVVKHYYEAYSPYAYDKTGVWRAASVPIYRLTKVTQCRTASTCSGSVNELVKTIHYDVNENLLPDYQITASGDGSVSLRTDFEYDIYGNLVKKIGPHPKDETYTFYDLQQRVIGTISPNSDGKGRVGIYSKYNADGNVTYTKKGMLSATTLSALENMPAYTEETVNYNATTGLAERKIKDGIDVSPSVVNMSYDSEFRLQCKATRVSGFDSSNACYAYGGNQSIPDQIIKYEYDTTGALRKTITGYGTSDERIDLQNIYNSKGQIEKKIDGNGNVTLYNYDAYGRPERTTFPSKTTAGSVNSSDYTFTTFEGTRVKTLRLRNGTVITFGYDAWGRTTSKTSPSNGTFGSINESFTYDNFTNLTAHTNTSSGIGSTTMTAGYNALGLKSSETTALGTVSYGYDEYGRRNRLTWPDAYHVTYNYGDSLLLQEIKENGSFVLASFDYDSYARRDSLTRGNGVTTSYEYNSFSRLTGMESGKPGSVATGDYSVSFEYNPASQITSKTENGRNSPTSSYFYSRQAESKNYIPNGLNQITNWSGTALTYDTNGNTQAIGSTSFTYNNDNLLTTAGGAQLQYDAEKRLYKVGSTCFLYDGAYVIAETNCSGTVLNRYVHGLNVDEPLVWYVGSGTSSKRYYTADVQGSIIGVTDNSGAIYAINSYDEYGIKAATNVGRFQFTGQIWLAEVGLYYYKARFYNPNLGRFMQTDPIGYKDGMNWYAYVGNDSINKTDPTGLCEYDAKGRAKTDCYTIGNISEEQIDTQSKKNLAQQKITITKSVDGKNHKYQVRGLICSTLTEGCNAAHADEVFAQVNRTDVPFSDEDLGSGIKILIKDYPRPIGNQPIYHLENIAERTSVNITLEGHNFHPGDVTHRVHFESGNLYYDMIGTGTGRAPSFNNWMGIKLFEPGVRDVVDKFGR